MSSTRNGDLYRDIVRHGQGKCETCGARSDWPPLSVHHPLGRGVVYVYDPRNGIVLCHKCHALYDHAFPLMVEKMRELGMHSQANWCEQEWRKVHHGAKACLDQKMIRRELNRMVRDLGIRGKTRHDVRDWDAPNMLDASMIEMLEQEAAP